MPQPQQPYTLFSLPLEIRLIIYRHALINKTRLRGRFSRSMVQDQVIVAVRKEVEIHVSVWTATANHMTENPYWLLSNTKSHFDQDKSMLASLRCQSILRLTGC